MREKLGELTMSPCRVQQDLPQEAVLEVPELALNAVRKVTCQENAQLVVAVAEVAPIELASNVVRKATCPENAQLVEEVALSQEVQ